MRVHSAASPATWPPPVESPGTWPGTCSRTPGTRARVPRPVATRIALVDLAGRQHVGLAAEAADALEALHEARPHAGAHPLEPAFARLAAASRAEYASLLADPGFMTFCSQATPIDVIEQSRIGSRPARRTGRRTIADLRAIPWVFSWSLNRTLLPGWFGFGSAVKQFVEREGEAGLAQLQEMHKNWAFFRGLMSNMDMVLSKTDMGIASRYAGLVKDGTAREKSRCSGRT